MSELTIPAAHNNVRLAASIAYADTGTENSRIEFYDDEDTLLVTMVLAKPCGAIVANKIVLEQEDAGGDQITVQGDAVRAVWINGDDDIVGEGSVTDEAGAGPFKLSGTTGTRLYAGAYAILGLTALD